MDRDGKRAIVIKRVKKVQGGHHGGAWKVAYADFVTAMMAFFLLMWLLSTTTEEQRRGLADYFSPDLPLFSEGGGGDGPFGGSSMFSDDTLARDEIGRRRARLEELAAGLTDQTFWEIEQELLGGSGDAMEADPLLQHIRTRLTDEGLIIEVFDIEGSTLFRGATAEPEVVLERLLAMIGRVLGRTMNPVAITGHLGPSPRAVDPWLLSADRAQTARRLLVAAGVSEPRLARVTGKADRSRATEAPDDPRNRRIEVTLLRRFGP